MLTNRLRFACDPQQVDHGLLNLVPNSAAAFWRAGDLRVEFGILNGPSALADISTITDITCRVKENQGSLAATLMSKTLYSGDLNGALSWENWQVGTDEHGVFAFSSDETNLPMDHAYRELWLVIVATLSDGSEVPLGAGKVTCHDANYLQTDTPATFPPAVALAGPQGQKGWSPLLAIVSDGTRRVLQVTGWSGGAGSPPASGQYLGTSGLVSSIAAGVDLSGVQIFTGITAMSFDATNGGMQVVTTGGTFFIPLNAVP